MTPMSDHEKFIPITKAELLQRLVRLDGLSTLDRQQFLELSDAMEWRLHDDFRRQQEQLKASYTPFDPDSDCIGANLPTEQRDEVAESVMDQFTRLLEQANYVRLERSNIESALSAASDWGVNLQIDFNIFERLEVYERGNFVGRRSRRNWRSWYRTETVDVPTYRRLAIIFRLKANQQIEKSVDRNAIFVKLFKNIPKADLEMMLPGTRVCMNWLDHGKILFPTLSGIGLMIWKVIQGTLILVFSGIQGLMAFLVAVAGTLGYGVKSVFGYLNTKNKYQLNVTRHLYYQNLDNNLGVLFRILYEAEEQEYRETLLAYFLLWRDAPVQGWTAQELDVAAEACLDRVLKAKVDFEVVDAIEKLRRLQLAVPLPLDRYRATGISDAIQQLRNQTDRDQRMELHSLHFKPPPHST